MAEDVLSVCHSPDQRLLAVALLDATVKVFFADTLKVAEAQSGKRKGFGGGCNVCWSDLWNLILFLTFPTLLPPPPPPLPLSLHLLPFPSPSTSTSSSPPPSLQFFLSLYGHKLPVLSMDVSSVSCRHCWW